MSQAQWSKNRLSRSNVTTVCWCAKRPKRKLPCYSSLDSQEMPLPFKHIFAIILYTMPLLGRRLYIHGMVRFIPGPKLNVYRRTIPPMMLFRGQPKIVTKHYSLMLNNCFSIARTSQMCPKIDGVRYSVAHAIICFSNILYTQTL